jgi:hypothetical protein
MRINGFKGRSPLIIPRIWLGHDKNKDSLLRIPKGLVWRSQRIRSLLMMLMDWSRGDLIQDTS